MHALASYVLLSLGGEQRSAKGNDQIYRRQHDVTSMLFVIAIAYLYAVIGTLNMAHLSERVAEVGQDGVMHDRQPVVPACVRTEGFAVFVLLAAWFLQCSASGYRGHVRCAVDESRDLFDHPHVHAGVLPRSGNYAYGYALAGGADDDSGGDRRHCLLGC